MLSTLILLVAAQTAEVHSVARPTERVTGGVLAPAALPSGTNALYAFVGAPDLGVGYRQGFGSGVELEGRVAVNLFEISAIAELGFKYLAYERDRLRLAPGLALGFEFDSGARYFDRFNFAFVGLRPRPSLTGSWAFTETIAGVAQLDLPVSFAFSQGFQFTPLLGAGAEFHLGSGFSLMVTGHGGFDVTQEPLATAQVRGAWAARLGVGYRIF